MIRIVKMTFKEASIPAFLEIFEASKPKIEAFPGCHAVALMRDINDPRVLMTYSHWDGPEALEHYRNSELFATTWAKTKIHFDDRPEAWSLEPVR